MSTTMSERNRGPLLVRTELPDKAAGMAKVSHVRPEKELTWDDLSWCLGHVQHHFRLNLDEFAHELGKDPRQVQKWLHAKERPQIEAAWAIPRFRRQLIIAMAHRADGIDVMTTISVRTA